MSNKMACDDEDDTLNEDELIEEEDMVSDKSTSVRGRGRGQCRKRGRGGAGRGRGRKPLKSPDIIQDNFSDDSNDQPAASKVNICKRKVCDDDEKEQNNAVKNSTSIKKSLRTSSQNDIESGQPPGGGGRSRRRSAVLATFEEPPDAILSEDESSSIEESEEPSLAEESVTTVESAIAEEPTSNNVSAINSSNEVKDEEDLPHSGEEGDDFHNFSVTDSLNNEDTSRPETPCDNNKDEGSEVGSESEEKAPDEGVVKKRGRGRPPLAWKRGRQKKSPALVQIPPAAISDIPDYLKEEFQHAFEIYLALRSVPKIGPFLDRPSANKYGMSTYYNVIKTPMWLDEVKRKLMCHGYSCISQFISDVRLMLENCYKYWGQYHKFSRTALQIESKLEQKIESLPQALKEKCKDVNLEGDENLDVVKMEPDDFRNFPEDSADIVKNKSKNFSSKILARLMAKTIENPIPEIDKKREEEVLAWERSHLITSSMKEEINSSWEVAAVGMFINTAHVYFNLNKIRQYEMERMISMPKESITLATIMTSLLSPTMIRNKLDATIPIMSYSVWNKKLRKKVEDWFSTYNNKNGNETEVFLSCGIEPQFWKAMGYVNQYEEKDFSQITYHQRCYILKALCDNLYYTNKSLQELLNSPDDENCILGSLNNFVYFYLPLWPDIRVYKIKTISKDQVASMKNISVLTNKFLNHIALPDSSTDANNVDGTDLFKDFSLVADSPAELQKLVDEVKCLNSNLHSKLTSLIKESEEKYQSTLPVLSQIYDEWSGYGDRSVYDSESITYWEINEDVSSDKGYFDVEDPAVLGKRTRKIKLSTSNLTSSSEEEDIFDRDDDGSDWECPSEKRKAMKKEKPLRDMGDSSDDGTLNRPKKKRLKKTPRAKSKSELSDKRKNSKKLLSSVNDGNLASTAVIKNVTSLIGKNKSGDDHSMSFNSMVPAHDDIVIKTEPPMYPVKVELDDSDMSIGEKAEPLKTAVKQEPSEPFKNEIKQEMTISSDVISLSSQEEDDDDDVIITTPVKQMPQPVPITPPTTVRTPLNNFAQSPRNTTPLARSPLVSSPRMATPGTPPANNPRLNFTPSPRMSSPRQSTPRMPTTPRQRFSSPLQQNYTPPMISSPRQRNVTPRSFSPGQARPPAATPPQVSRNLFNNIRPNQPPRPNQPTNSSKTIKASLTFGKRDDGSYGYLARLPDGGVINMSPQQIDNIKKKNGSIPSVINIPIG